MWPSQGHPAGSSPMTSIQRGFPPLNTDFPLGATPSSSPGPARPACSSPAPTPSQPHFPPVLSSHSLQPHRFLVVPLTHQSRPSRHPRAFPPAVPSTRTAPPLPLPYSPTSFRPQISSPFSERSSGPCERKAPSPQSCSILLLALFLSLVGSTVK